MKSTKVSYSFGSIDVKVPKIPSSDYSSVPHSVDFIPPSPGLGFLRETGGKVFGKLFYTSPFSIDDLLDIPYKGWVETYVTNLIHDLTTGEGGLSEGAVRALFNASPSSVFTYNSTTGRFAIDLDLSKYDNTTTGFLDEETDPLFTASPAANITLSHISNWRTAYGWGDHSNQGYLTLDTLPEYPDEIEKHIAAITEQDIRDWSAAYGWGDHEGLYYEKGVDLIPWSQLDNKPSFHTVATSGDYGDLTNLPSIYDFLSVGSANQTLFTDINGIGIEWRTITHDSILPGDNQHLTTEEKEQVLTPASAESDGYLTKEDWIDFDSKMSALTPGRLLELDGTILHLDSSVLPVDDSATSNQYTLSAQKIYELLQGEEEEEEEDTTSVSYGQSFTIFIPVGSDLPTKLGGTYRVPAGWTLNAIGGSNGDLEITHNLEKLPASIAVYRRNGDSTKSKLEGLTAYGDAKSTTEDKKLVLTSYANTSLATEIRLIF